MGYAILRTQKLKSGIAMRRSLAHAFRERETPNADASRTPDNTHIGADGVDAALAKFNERLATQDKVRKNAVLAVEYLITASPEAMHGKSRQEQDAYFRDGLEWLKRRHGAENVIYAGIHRDETTPHMYAYVVPLDERGKLNCRAFLGGAKALSTMQTEFAQEVGHQHELQRGIEGSKARHTSIQQYYSRVNQAFEQLPQVQTKAPPRRDEPEKPGLFASADAKEAYKADLAKWEKEQAQRQQHMVEVRAQRDAAVATARRHEAQAKEAAVLKAQMDQLKKSNGAYAKQAASRKAEVAQLLAIAELFTPEEIRQAQERKQREINQVKEAQRVASIQAEAAKRIGEIQHVLRTSAGAEHTWATRAAEALRKAEGDPAKVDWKAVERRTIMESIGKHGQSPESVTKAVLSRSPLRADPSTHDAIRQEVQVNTKQLQEYYAKKQEQDLGRPGPSPMR